MDGGGGGSPTRPATSLGYQGGWSLLRFSAPMQSKFVRLPSPSRRDVPLPASHRSPAPLVLARGTKRSLPQREQRQAGTTSILPSFRPPQHPPKPGIPVENRPGAKRLPRASDRAPASP